MICYSCPCRSSRGRTYLKFDFEEMKVSRSVQSTSRAAYSSNHSLGLLLHIGRMSQKWRRSSCTQYHSSFILSRSSAAEAVCLRRTHAAIKRAVSCPPVQLRRTAARYVASMNSAMHPRLFKQNLLSSLSFTWIYRGEINATDYLLD